MSNSETRALLEELSALHTRLARSVEQSETADDEEAKESRDTDLSTLEATLYLESLKSIQRHLYQSPRSHEVTNGSTTRQRTPTRDRGHLSNNSSVSWGDIDDTILERLGVTLEGICDLKPPEDLAMLQSIVEESGENHMWSARGLFEHFKEILALVSPRDKGNARSWADALCYRADAIISTPEELKLTVAFDQRASNTDFDPSMSPSPGTCVHYHLHTDPTLAQAKRFVDDLTLKFATNLPNHTLFVASVKGVYKYALQLYLPLAVQEMYACARTLGKPIIRGAITNGSRWIFIILKLKPDQGGTYAQSLPMDVIATSEMNGRGYIPFEPSLLVSGVLAHWIKHTHEDIREDDWLLPPRELNNKVHPSWI